MCKWINAGGLSKCISLGLDVQASKVSFLDVEATAHNKEHGESGSNMINHSSAWAFALMATMMLMWLEQPPVNGDYYLF